MKTLSRLALILAALACLACEDQPAAGPRYRITYTPPQGEVTVAEQEYEPGSTDGCVYVGNAWAGHKYIFCGSVKVERLP